MTILQILPELNIGGVERGCVDLARELVAAGHKALVISYGGALVKQLESYGAKHIRLPVHRKSLFSILVCIPKVARILRREKVDIVHARSRVPALIAFLACRRTATNFVTTCHGYYSRHFFSRVMGWGKCVIVSSSVVTQHMLEDFGVPRQRIRLVPRGVDLEEFQFRQSDKRKTTPFTIGVIGRLTPIKGHKYFLKALARIIRVVPKVRALIVGDASPGKEKYKEEIKMLTRRLSLDRFVEFIPRQSNIPQVLSGLDVLVLPTVTQEAFGRVLIEAGACGVPVIATRVGGVLDIIKDGVNGILVAPADASDLASAIIRIFRQPEFAQKLVLAGRKRVEKDFTLKQMAEKTIQAYEEVQKTFRILVIKLSALGDIILATPTLRSLREKFPHAHISVLVAPAHRQVLQECPYVDSVLEFPLENIKYRDILRVSSLLRKINFDIVVDLQNNRKSHLLAYLSGASRRYGCDNGNFSFLLNKKIKDVKTPLSPIKHQARTLKLLDVEALKEDLALWPNKNDESWAEDFLKTHKKSEGAPLIGINLGASIKWPTKIWSVNKFAVLLDKLADAGMEVVVTGEGRDKESVRNLSRLCKNHFIDAVEKTQILQLASLIKRCNVYISSDSAPLHIAYAMKTPVIALFGPTDPKRHTIAAARQIIIKKDIDCSPCYKRQCRQHSCMRQIPADGVFEAVKLLLS